MSRVHGVPMVRRESIPLPSRRRDPIREAVEEIAHRGAVIRQALRELDIAYEGRELPEHTRLLMGAMRETLEGRRCE